jgi:uncharacterized membrane protein
MEEPGQPHGSSSAPPVSERGRDLTLLALGLIVAIEGLFAALSVAWGLEGRLVLSMGRFALISGMAYMTWQGFAFPRWLLVALVAFAVIGGPIAVWSAMATGGVREALLPAFTMLGYAAAGALLVLSPEVRSFLAQRRRLLDHDRMHG